MPHQEGYQSLPDESDGVPDSEAATTRSGFDACMFVLRFAQLMATKRFLT